METENDNIFHNRMKTKAFLACDEIHSSHADVILFQILLNLLSDETRTQWTMILLRRLYDSSHLFLD